jgi:hypothetical protein
MPNWCDTTYKCVGDKKEVRSLYKVLEANSKRKRPRIKNGFGVLWLGCIIDALGEDWEKYRCRGEVIDCELDDNVRTIFQNTAWCEQEGFRQCIEKAFPSIKVYYRDQESGCERYCTNDSNGDFFTDRFFLDNYEGGEYFENLPDACEYMTKLLGREVNTVAEIEAGIEEYLEEHEDDDDVWMSFHEFEIVDD